MKLFLCGDVMTGRGIDQILPHPSDPILFEPYVRDARQYCDLAEAKHGSLPRNVSPDYIWGDALAEWERQQVDFKFINLETALTTSSTPWPNKSIHYRMHPQNISVLTKPGFDLCTLANNHILDWHRAGLKQTLDVLKAASMAYAGAGLNENQAMQPARLKKPAATECILVFAFGCEDSGIDPAWAATAHRPGIFFLKDLGQQALGRVLKILNSFRRDREITIVSVHWGSNWGYDIPEQQRNFAQALIDQAQVDVVWGHSSHHPRPLEVYKGKLIIYGCGDFINDYEGIFLDFDRSTHKLARLELIPMQIRKFQLHYAGHR